MSNQEQKLDTCGCCEGVKALTPAQIKNLPGLSVLAYRVGTHASFKITMQSALSGQPQLRQLTTRDNDDPAIALCDAWATVLDVLSFYQERIANEGYLRTATERRSILEMARSIGYELRPGVAAGTYLAFTLETAKGSPTTAKIGVGTKAQSVPGQDESPQVFETVEEIEARAEWNAIKPRLTQPQEVSVNMGSIILKGTAINLKPGDMILILDGSGGPKSRKILNVTLDNEAKTTRIDFDNRALSPANYVRPSQLQEGTINDFPTKVEFDENIVKDTISKTWKEEDLSALVKIQDWSVEELVTNIAKHIVRRKPGEDTGVFTFRQRASVFGYNAAKQVTYEGVVPKPPSEWKEWLLDEEKGKVFLDNAYDEIIPKSYIAIKKPNESSESARIYQVNQAEVCSRTAYGVSSKTTLLTLSSEEQWWDSVSGSEELSVIRGIAVYAQSEQLELADVPIEDLIQGDTITLDRMYLGLKTGQRVVLTGERRDLKGVIASETRTLKQVIIEAGFTVITLDKPLANSYERHTVTINANVAQATHGETKKEVLGSGDGSQTFQKFELKQKPLTYTSAATSSGTKSTLEIRVNDLLWEEVSTLNRVPPEKRAYITRIADDGKVTVQFGDGINGARVPTGVENVVATYRVGTGLDGMLKAGQISTLMTRPLGVREVSNPLPSTGADNPEKLDRARRNAPLTVLTFDRIVSLSDFEDFANAFAGIGKAQATCMWDGEQPLVHITVAGADGGPVTPTSDLYRNLIDGIDAARHPDHRVKVDSYKPLTFNVKAKVRVDGSYIVEDVLASVKAALKNTFSFEKRWFGQAVTPSEVLAVMQRIQGVIAVDLEELGGKDPFEEEHFRLPADIAQLLTINPDGIVLTEMTV